MAAAPMMMIAAATVQAVGAIRQGNQAQAAADSEAAAMEYNAASARARAEQASRMAGIQEDEQRRKARSVIGMQLAGSAESGTGINGDLLRQSIFNMETDTGSIRYEGQLKAAGLNDQAALDMVSADNARIQGRQAMQAGYLNAAGSLLNAGSSYYKGTK